MVDSLANPYVGPRTFTAAEAHLFFGREREASELLSLVISERLTLFYAQSGAGKSSLLHTRLIPQLGEAGFVALPVGRVSGDLPPGMNQVANIFAFNLMLSLERDGGKPDRLGNLSLSQFLARLTSEDGQKYYYDDNAVIEAAPPEEADYHVLIIDQFEEIITGHPDRWPDRADFFHQLEQAMADDPNLWVVLTLREDYVAALDPYSQLLAGRLRARYYMQRMSYEAALEAIRQPATLYGRPFAPGVAEALADNLRQIKIQGTTATQLGQFVEPVQLQVVCFRLWENLKARPAAEITAQNLQELGNVDTALAEFYEQALARVAAETGVSELDLRDWFERYLITEAGTRGGVYRGKLKSSGLPTHAADMLANQFILRTDNRAGGTWYELVHDRFVEPIRQSNQRWRDRQPLLQVARSWLEATRSDSLLLEGQTLKEALAGNWQGLGPLVEEFLTASRAAQQAKEDALEAEKEAQRQRELETARQLAEEAEARRLAELLRSQEAEARAREQAEAAAQLRRQNRRLNWLLTIAITMALVAVGLVILVNWSNNYAYEQSLAAAATAQYANIVQNSAQYDATQVANVQQIAQAEADKAATADAAKATADAGATAVAAKATAYTNATAAAAKAAATAKARDSLIARLEAQLTAALATPTRLPTPTAATVSPPLAPTDTPTANLATATAQAVETLQAQQTEVAATQAIESIQATLAVVVAAQTAAARPTATATQTPTPTATWIPTATPITFPPSGRIVFVSNRFGNKGSLIMMQADGGNANRLTPSHTEAFHPSYSPEQDLVIYSTADLDNKPAYLYTITLYGEVKSNPGGQADIDWWEPALSPDGQTIAFVTARDGNSEIYSMNLDGSNVKNLTNDPADDRAPAWSPDKKRLVFVSKRRGGSDIWLMNADGSRPVRLTANGDNPAWSPDGKQIAFVSTRNGNAELYLADLSSGGKDRRLTNTPQEENYPAWSPDDNWLVFTRYADTYNKTEIFVMTLDGRYVTNLTNNPADDWQPIWVR